MLSKPFVLYILANKSLLKFSRASMKVHSMWRTKSEPELTTNLILDYLLFVYLIFGVGKLFSLQLLREGGDIGV